MLFERKFSDGDTISLKLVSGDEIIGKFVKEDMAGITLNKPVMIAMTPKGPGLAPVMMTVNPDNDYTINRSVILFQGTTVREIAEQYIYQTTGIQPVSAGSIVTG